MIRPAYIALLLSAMLCLGCQEDVPPDGDDESQSSANDAFTSSPAESATQRSTNNDRKPPNADDAMRCLIDNDVAGLQQLIRDGLNPNACPDPERQDMTLLHFAGSLGSEGTIRALVNAGADIDAKTNFSVTPLLVAVTLGNSENALALIELGADVDSGNLAGATPLHFAAAKTDLSIVQALLAKGADVNAKTNVNGGTALSAAVNADSLEIVECLLENGADVRLVDNSGKRPIDYAKSEAMKQLLGFATDRQEQGK